MCQSAHNADRRHQYIKMSVLPSTPSQYKPCEPDYLAHKHNIHAQISHRSHYSCRQGKEKRYHVSVPFTAPQLFRQRANTSQRKQRKKDIDRACQPFRKSSREKGAKQVKYHIIKRRVDIVRLIFPYVRKMKALPFLHRHIIIIRFTAGIIGIRRQLRRHPYRLSILRHMIGKPIRIYLIDKIIFLCRYHCHQDQCKNNIYNQMPAILLTPLLNCCLHSRHTSDYQNRQYYYNIYLPIFPHSRIHPRPNMVN